MTVIDVMIVYTPGAKSKSGSEANMKAVATNMIDWTNTALKNSGLDVYYRLVYVGEVSYTDSHDLSNDLEWLQAEAKKPQGAIGTLRQSFGGDLLSLIVEEGGDYCGLGYVGPDKGKEYGLSVVAYACLPDSFAHETGHNMGCVHNPESSNNMGFTDYAFGHRVCDANSGFRTVMSYWTNDCQVKRVPVFSTPDVTWSGKAAGSHVAKCETSCSAKQCATSCRDCAATIEVAAATVSAYLQTKVPLCGDGAVQEGEHCDGIDMSGKTCSDYGSNGGRLQCFCNCTVDTSLCSSSCGNGKLDPGEVCDGSNLNEKKCSDFSCGLGLLRCRSDCKGFEVSGCLSCPAACGDNVINQASEECDGDQIGQGKCDCFRRPICTSQCKLDYSNCNCDDCVFESAPIDTEAALSSIPSWTWLMVAATTVLFFL